MVKTYLRYALKETIGQIAGGTCSIVVLSELRNEIIVACNSFVLCFSLKTGELRFKLIQQKTKISSLAISNNNMLSVGYENGSVSLIELEKNKFIQTFFNHKSAITSMVFNKEGTQLVSGSNDTTIIIYDLLGEVPLLKFTGHKDNIIKVDYYYLMNENIILSLGKDNAFKLWDTNTQMCIFTHVDMVNKISQFISIDDILLFGSFGDKIKIYQINNNLIQKDRILNSEIKNILLSKGELNKQSPNKVISFYYSKDANLLSILSNDNSIEFYKILNKKEIKNRIILMFQAKDKNFKKEKIIQKEKYKEISCKVKELILNKQYNVKVHFKSLFKFDESSSKTKTKIIFVFLQNREKFGILTNNNMLEFYTFSTEMLNNNIYQFFSYEIEEILPENDQLVVKKDYSLSSIGHREAIRFIQYSTDSHKFVTLSNDCIKLWNSETFNVIKTLTFIKNATCFVFIKSDTYGVITTRQGEMVIVDVNSFNIVHQLLKAHEDTIWKVIAYKISKNKIRLITCSSDKVIKYWLLSLNENNQFSLVIYSELGLIDSITYCLLTNNKKYLAYSLMDNSIKIIYEDTQKIFLTLYGHKMPVNCFDISSDDLLLVSGSGDKNVKIWGMDFGDCHKSFFAHQDMITCVKFVPITHFFFSSSKDGTIKYFDGDLFELIMEFNDDFFDSIWWLDINKEGTQLAAVSSDYSVKLYEITEEQIVSSFAQDDKLEKIITEEAEKDINRKDAVINPFNKEIDAIIPIKKRMDTIGFAETIMDAVILCDQFKDEVYQYEIAQKEYEVS